MTRHPQNTVTEKASTTKNEKDGGTSPENKDALARNLNGKHIGKEEKRNDDYFSLMVVKQRYWRSS